MTFTYLPAFTQYILDHRLEEYVLEQIRLSREVKLPLMAYFEAMPEEQLLALSTKSSTEFLTYFSTNQVDQQIAESLESWTSNQLPLIDRNQVAAEDITLVSYIRKQTFLKLLPGYTSDLTLAINLISELDEYSLKTETLQTNTYISLLNEKINEQLHFNEKITNTSPGIIYVFDLLEHKTVYSNQKVGELLGYLPEESTAMGSSYLELVQHPDDIPRVLAHFSEFSSARDGEVLTFEHRLKMKSGNYRWMRNYESVFRRTESGAPWELIGIGLDIEQEHQNAQELMRRETQLLEAQELANLGSFEWNLTTHDVQSSPQLKKILEFPEGERLAEFMAYVHPADRAKVQATIQAAIEQRGLYDCEYRYLRNQREKVIWSRGTISTAGAHLMMRGTVMDVTQQRELLQQLQQSDTFYRQSQALTHLGNWAWDIPQNQVYWSDELYRIYGLEPQSEEVSFERFLELVHPDDRETVAAKVSTSLETHQPNDFHHRIRLPNGTVRVLHAKGEVLLNEAGVPYKMIGTGHDVTEQRFIEEQLLEQKVFIQKIANAAPSLIASYNINTGIYTFISEGLEKLLGYEAQWAKAQGVAFFAGLIHPDDLGPLVEANSKAIELANQSRTRDEVILEFEYRMRHHNGEYRWFHTYGTVFDRNRQGKVEHVLNVSVDVTERVEAERKISEKTVELQQSNASLKEFAQVASHDLKEPLRKISMFGDRLLHTHRDRLTAEGHLHLQKIIDSSNRMQTMIQDILSISTIAGNKSFQGQSLQILLGDAVQVLEHTIEAKNAHVETDALPQALVDSAQFRQLFLNLLTNSLKFTRPDLSPRIQITHQFLQPNEVPPGEIGKATRYLQLRFADNGIGFENKFAGKIFTIFQRLHGKSEYEGTGIGLAICKKIVENHGGMIWAESAPNQGAAFTIVLPQ